MRQQLRQQELEDAFDVVIDACNIYALALKLATKDITKIFSRYSMQRPDELAEYYIDQAKKQLKAIYRNGAL